MPQPQSSHPPLHQTALGRLVRACWITAALSTGAAQAQTEFREIKPEDVTVVFGGEQIDITLDTVAPVSLAQAWAVLTDYDHMNQFLPGLELSEVASRQGNTLRVHQRGSTRAGLLHLDYENVRDINLTPQRLISAHGVSGDVKRLDSSTELHPRDGGDHRLPIES